MQNKYSCVTTIEDIRSYLGNAKEIAFDYETAPNDKYRNEDKAALDPAKCHIVGCSFSNEIGTGIYVPVANLKGENIDKKEFMQFLGDFLADTSIIKIAHNIAFESCVSYANGIVIQPPVYDTICASQLTQKGNYDFRKLADSGLKSLATEICREPLPSFEAVTEGKHFDELDGHDAETVRYGCADSDFSLRLYYIFNDWFSKYLPKHKFLVQEVESPTAVYIGIMKTNGVPLDLPLMQEKKSYAEEQMQRVKEKKGEQLTDVKKEKFIHTC